MPAYFPKLVASLFVFYLLRDAYNDNNFNKVSASIVTLDLIWRLNKRQKIFEYIQQNQRESSMGLASMRFDRICDKCQRKNNSYLFMQWIIIQYKFVMIKIERSN